MIQIMRWKWTPAIITLGLGVIEALRKAGILNSTVSNVLQIILFLIGLSWVFAGSDKLRRFCHLYLWLIFIVSLGLSENVANGLTALTGTADSTSTYLIISAIHLIIVFTVLSILGTWKKRDVEADKKIFYARFAGGLFIVAATVVWIGAMIWPGLEPQKILEHRFAHFITTGCFFIGGLILLTGFAFFTMAIHEAGERCFSSLGLIGFMISTVLWIIHLTYRFTIPVHAADELAATGNVPPYFQPLRLWAGLMYGVYIFMVYLSIASYGAALLKTNFLSKGFARTCIVIGFIFAFMNTAMVPGFDMPLEVPMVPCLIGVLLLINPQSTFAETVKA